MLEDEHDQGDRRRLQFRDAVAVRCETQFEDWFNFDGCITKGFLKSIPQRFNSYDQVDVSNLAKVKQIARRIIQNEHDVRKNPKHQSGQHVVALAATTYSVCVAVQPLCVLALMCRGFFDIWKPSVIPQTKVLVEFLALVVCGLCGILLSRLRLNMFLELWRFRFVSTQSRQFPCNTPRLILVTLVLSLSPVMATRGSQLLSGAEVLMLSPVAVCTLPCWCLSGPLQC